MPRRNRLIPAFCIAVCALVGGAAGSCSKSRKEEDKPKTDRTAAHRVTLFVTTDLQGTIEPCGCTTDPHGGLARTARVVTEARDAASHPVLYLDGGSLLYSKPELPPALEAQEKLKADLIARVVQERFRPAAIGLGPYDLAEGVDAVRPPRQAANLAESAGVPLESPKVVEAGGARVGVFGVIAPEALGSAGLEASDPVQAARAAVADLEEAGARVVVALAHMTRPEATELAREVEGIDFVVVGRTVAASELDIKHDPVEVAGAWLIEPADRGQVLSRLDLTVRRGGGPFADAVGETRAEVLIEGLAERLSSLRGDLAEWESDPDADEAFVAKKKKELERLEAEKKRLEDDPLRVPDEGSYFVFEQIPIKKQLACHEEVQEAKVAFDEAAGKANLKKFADVEPPPAPEGEAGFVGVEECEMCHSEEVEQWKTTRHHDAWETLETYGKQYNLDCVYCHVTGFDRPGGSNLSHLEGLRDVQCEVCHGPGSLHVEREGDPEAIVGSPERDTCVRCHNEEHSDTFAFEPYLRNITGDGHGDALRKKLGDGPTGHELRKAALKKAGAEIGEHCLK